MGVLLCSVALLPHSVGAVQLRSVHAFAAMATTMTMMMILLVAAMMMMMMI